MEDTLRRDDLRPTVPVKTKMITRMYWGIMRGDGRSLVTQTIYPAAQAKRFLRLAKHWGHDVYMTRFGKVNVPT